MGRYYYNLLSIIAEILLGQKKKGASLSSINPVIEEKLMNFLMKQAVNLRADNSHLPFNLATADKNVLNTSDGFVISSDSALKDPIELLDVVLNHIMVSGTFEDIMEIPVKFYCGSFPEKAYVITTVSFENWNQMVH